MLSPGIREILQEERHPLHTIWLREGLARIDAAERHWAQRHADWRESERLHRAYRDPDDQDKQVRQKELTKGVQKIVVPYTKAIVQARTAFHMAVLTQRSPIFPVAPLGPSDQLAAILHELIQDYQVQHMDPSGVLALYQMVHDSERYGVGIIKNSFTVREWPDLAREVVPIMGEDGMPMGAQETLTRRSVVAYEGNQWLNISPYHWFPDPAFPVGRFQDGEFCGDAFERSFTYLRQKEAQGLVAGMRFVKERRLAGESGYGLAHQANQMGMSDLARISGMGDQPSGQANVRSMKAPVLVHELYWYADPDDLEMPDDAMSEDDRALVTDDTPTVWLMRIANRSRVISLEPAVLPGRRFPYEAVEANYDLHCPGNPGTTEEIAGLQHVYNWLFNSRMQSVRRTVNNQYVVDPSMVEEADLESDDPGLLIRLKRQHWQSGATREAVFPLPVQDVTQSHIGVDAPFVRELIDTVAGGNLLFGVANTGRRSATEVSGQLQNLNARMKLQNQILVRQGIVPLVMQMLRNNQTFLDGQVLQLREPYATMFGQPAIEVTPDMLQGEFNIPLGELGIPSDQQAEAMAMKELLMQGIQSGAAASVFQNFPWDTLFARFLWRTGIKDLHTFGMTIDGLARSQPQMQVMPDDQVMAQAQQGNLMPGGPSPDAMNGSGGPVGSDGSPIFPQ